MINNTILIDAKGVYLTRGGLQVRIDQIDENPDTTVTAFKCKGYIHYPREGKKDKLEFNIWHRSGMFTCFEGHLDIVSKFNEN